MKKRLGMASQVNRKVWITIIDCLRIITPILCVVITTISGIGLYALKGYEAKQTRTANAIEKQSGQLNEINTKLAVLIERESFGTARVEETRTELAALTKIANRNATDIQVLYSKVK